MTSHLSITSGGREFSQLGYSPCGNCGTCRWEWTVDAMTGSSCKVCRACGAIVLVHGWVDRGLGIALDRPTVLGSWYSGEPHLQDEVP